MERSNPGVWRGPKDYQTAGQLEKAELIISELVTDPNGNNDRFHRLDEMRPNVQARLAIREIAEEFEQYKQSADHTTAPGDETRLTSDMFERD